MLRVAFLKHVALLTVLAVSTARAADTGEAKLTSSSVAGSPVVTALAERLGASAAREFGSFYRARGFRPLWIDRNEPRVEAGRVIALIRDAGDDGFDPERFDWAALRRTWASARSGDPGKLAELELALSTALARYAQALRRPSRASTMIFVPPLSAPVVPSVGEVLDAASRAPSLADGVAAVRHVNPVYDSLRAAYDDARYEPASRSPAIRTAILGDLDRARALPRDLGDRYLLVNTATATMSLVERGQVRDTMLVVVGKPAMPTPTMAALIRFAVLNPYWNLPPDLMAQRAAAIVREGPALLARERLELLSGWIPDARVLAPDIVDWRDVASGRQRLRARQLPGPENMMGAIKFILPNRLGVYLHDTPYKSLFKRADRRLSSGCVRLQDAPRVGRWLFGGEIPEGSGLPEQRVDLPEPIPVYMIHLATGSRPELRRATRSPSTGKHVVGRT